MSLDEYRTHMSLWAILAAPLLAGNDLTTMTPETIALLTNHDVIAIDQDPAGHQGDRVSAAGMTEVWARTMADGSKAVGIFNRDESPAEGSVSFESLGFTGSVHVRDVWQAKDLGAMGREYKVHIPAHGVVLLRVSK
jgi:alpha-galactosidase